MSKRKLSNTNIETVTFNVSGQKYEVLRNQFDKYPDSMLAKNVSECWLEDPSQDIFIPRDGSLFRHVLSFIRDGKVFLWHGITKEEFRLELDYYGIDCDDNIGEYIHEKLPISINMDIDGYIQGLKNKQTKYLQDYQAKKGYIDIAIYCMKAYYAGRFGSLGLPAPNGWSYESKVAKWRLVYPGRDKNDWNCISEAWNATIHVSSDRMDEVNQLLSEVSLGLISMTYEIDHFQFEMTEIMD